MPPPPSQPLVDDDGFALAMRFGSASTLFWDSPYWKNAEVIDRDDMTPTKDADGKFSVFSTMAVNKIKGCLLQGCKTYDLPAATTLQDLFTNTPEGSQNNIQFSESAAECQEWGTIAGKAGQLETGWQKAGINFYDDQSNYQGKVRFGAMFNNEPSVYTTNDVVGFGGQEAGNAKVWGRESVSGHTPSTRCRAPSGSSSLKRDFFNCLKI